MFSSLQGQMQNNRDSTTLHYQILTNICIIWSCDTSTFLTQCSFVYKVLNSWIKKTHQRLVEHYQEIDKTAKLSEPFCLASRVHSYIH